MLVSVLLETWAEGTSPTYFPRTTPLKAGTVDVPARNWSQYGAEEGVWRILGILERTVVPATVFANALSVERSSFARSSSAATRYRRTAMRRTSICST